MSVSYLQYSLHNGDSLAGAGRAVDQVGGGAGGAGDDVLHSRPLFRVQLHLRVEKTEIITRINTTTLKERWRKNGEGKTVKENILGNN